VNLGNSSPTLASCSDPIVNSSCDSTVPKWPDLDMKRMTILYLYSH